MLNPTLRASRIYPRAVHATLDRCSSVAQQHRERSVKYHCDEKIRGSARSCPKFWYSCIATHPSAQHVRTDSCKLGIRTSQYVTSVHLSVCCPYTSCVFMQRERSNDSERQAERERGSSTWTLPVVHVPSFLPWFLPSFFRPFYLGMCTYSLSYS